MRYYCPKDGTELEQNGGILNWSLYKCPMCERRYWVENGTTTLVSEGDD